MGLTKPFSAIKFFGIMLIFIGFSLMLTVSAPSAKAVVVNYDIASNTHDGCWWGASSFGNNVQNQIPGNLSGDSWNCYLYYTGVTIPVGATIVSATIDDTRFRCDAGTQLRTYGVDQSAPSVPTSFSNAEGKPRTTAFEDQDCLNPIVVTASVNELVSSYDYSSGANMLIYIEDDSTPNGNSLGYYGRDSGSWSGTVLTIEFQVANGDYAFMF